jgi:parallel beta-helix repeat protein
MKRMLRFAVLVLASALVTTSAFSARQEDEKNIPTKTFGGNNRVITGSCMIKPGVYELRDTGSGAVRIDADNVTVDFRGAVVTSCDVKTARRDGFDGTGILIQGRKNVTIKNAVVHGYRYNIRVLNCRNIQLIGCSACYSRAEKLLNRGVPANEFLSLRDLEAWRKYGSGIWIEKSSGCSARNCRALDAQNGIILVESDDCLITNSDVSFNSGWGIALWKSSDNIISWNHADFVNRICGYYFGLDSSALSLNDDCNRNDFVGNSITHSGDGFFLADYNESGGDTRKISTLPKGGSNDNIMAYNDGSWSPCNAFEGTFASGNVYYKNWASDATYGYWLGYARDTWILGGEIKRCATGGIAIEHGSGNRIEGNIFESNAGTDLHLWVPEGQPTDKHPSKKFEVRGNVIINSKLVFDLESSTDYYIGDNKLINAALPEGLVNTKPPDAKSAMSLFEASPQYRKLLNILATRPKDFKFYRETTGPFGMRWFRMDEFSPRDFREELAAESSVGWSGLDLFVFDPKATRISAKGKVTVERDGQDPHLMHLAPTNAAASELVPYMIEFVKGKKSQTLAGELMAADWKLDWYRWDGKIAPENDAAWDALFSGNPASSERTPNTTWTLNRKPPAPVASGGYAVQASARIKFPAGTYEFAAGCRGGFRILIDGKPVVRAWRPWGNAQPGHAVNLTEGVHDVVIQHAHAAGPTEMRLFWSRSNP